MRTIIIGAVFAFALIGQALGGNDLTTWSANEIMPGCRSLIEKNTGGYEYAAGLCIGVLQALIMTRGPEIGIFCPPDGTTRGQVLAIVVRYIDQHPQDMHEQFELLARLALARAWPCKTKADK